jgi:hypothetical protein
MIWIKNKSRDAFSSKGLGECRCKRFRSYNMTTLKTLTIVAALLASGTSLAMAQNGPATGGQLPVAGGAGGGWYPGYGYGYAAPLYDYAAPAYGYAAPIYVAPPVYAAPPLYAVPAPLYGYYAVPYGYYGYPRGSREWAIERGW